MIPMQGGAPMDMPGQMPMAGTNGQQTMMDKWKMLDPQKRKMAMALMGNTMQGIAGGQTEGPMNAILPMLLQQGMGA